MRCGRAALWAAALAVALAACGKLGPPLRAPDEPQAETPPETPGMGSEAEAGQE